MKMQEIEKGSKLEMLKSGIVIEELTEKRFKVIDSA